MATTVSNKVEELAGLRRWQPRYLETAEAVRADFDRIHSVIDRLIGQGAITMEEMGLLRVAAIEYKALADRDVERCAEMIEELEREMA